MFTPSSDSPSVLFTGSNFSLLPDQDSPSPAPRGFIPVPAHAVAQRTPVRRVVHRRLAREGFWHSDRIMPLALPGQITPVLRNNHLKRERAFYIERHDRSNGDNEASFTEISEECLQSRCLPSVSPEVWGTAIKTESDPLGQELLLQAEDQEPSLAGSATVDRGIGVTTPVAGLGTDSEGSGVLGLPLEGYINGPELQDFVYDPANGVFVYSRNSKHIPIVRLGLLGAHTGIERWSTTLEEQPVSPEFIMGFQSRRFREMDASTNFVPTFDPQEECHRHARLLSKVDSRDPMEGGLTEGEFREFARNCWLCHRYMARFAKETHRCPVNESEGTANVTVEYDTDAVRSAGIAVRSNPGSLLSCFVRVGGFGLTVDDFEFLFLQCLDCSKIFARQAAYFHEHA